MSGEHLSLERAAGLRRSNLSVGHWQASRVYAVLGNAGEALAHANLALKFSQEQSPFYCGFAYEALARAEALTGSRAKVSEYVALAREQAAQVDQKDDRALLLKDLDSIESRDKLCRHPG